MALLDLWKKSREEIESKTVKQLITLAGDGELKDGADTSTEFRAFLKVVPSDRLRLYAQQCLDTTGMGLALQDIVNEVGRRLGFEVTDGVYRGASGRIGFDGIWQRKDGFAIVVEVKTTDVYQLDLETVDGYRRELIDSKKVTEGTCSNLIIVGRVTTKSIEAQIRGSPQAWSTRLISIDGLMKLVGVREAVDEPETVNRIHRLLEPREFTKLDDIVDLLFVTKEDIKKDDEEDDPTPGGGAGGIRVPRKSFNDACVRRVERHLKMALVKRSRASFSTADGSCGLVCCVSKVHEGPGTEFFWFGFHPHQEEFLRSYKQGYAAFGCGSEEVVVLLPFAFIEEHLPKMNTTETEGRMYWHIHIRRQGKSLDLLTKQGGKKISLLPFVLR